MKNLVLILSKEIDNIKLTYMLFNEKINEQDDFSITIEYCDCDYIKTETRNDFLYNKKDAYAFFIDMYLTTTLPEELDYLKEDFIFDDTYHEASYRIN